jgi:hypothetical protein
MRNIAEVLFHVALLPHFQIHAFLSLHIRFSQVLDSCRQPFSALFSNLASGDARIVELCGILLHLSDISTSALRLPHTDTFIAGSLTDLYHK